MIEYRRTGLGDRSAPRLASFAEMVGADEIARLKLRIAQQDLEIAGLKRDLASRDGNASRDGMGARRAVDAERARRYRERKKARA